MTFDDFAAVNSDVTRNKMLLVTLNSDDCGVRVDVYLDTDRREITLSIPSSKARVLAESILAQCDATEAT
jgi:hypothetical protein